MVPCQDFDYREDNFTLEAFTEIDVLVDGAIALIVIVMLMKMLLMKLHRKSKILQGRCEIRYAEVVREAQDAIAEAETEVSDGEQELADAKEKLEDGWEQLADAKKEVAEGQTELADAKTQVSDEKELDAAKDVCLTVKRTGRRKNTACRWTESDQSGEAADFRW